jgi:hypothetical protein
MRTGAANITEKKIQGIEILVLIEATLKFQVLITIARKGNQEPKF